ncbi:MAG TPA: pentapeptide repeat-containing protein [Myxococcaceae bacterium]|nr:pentapeptide repeat-containing protein [Myxococcaceae bacterium]
MLRDELGSLRQRIREAHDAQLLLKVQALLEACKAWEVELIVFPEYSLPWNLLEAVASAAGDMVVVAGTHTVDLPAHRSGLYQKLHAPIEPEIGQAVCPVLHRGRLLALQPKLNPARPEQNTMEPGQTWEPVMLPESIPGPMGTLVCLDFLYQRSPLHQQLVLPRLKECRFLVVPSLTPYYTLPEFEAKAWEEARRYKLPVLYCDGADGGGTTLFVDEGPPAELRQFPDKVGYLEPGDEGVIVAEVNLGMVHPGDSTSYDAPLDVRPVAEASLVYRTAPAGEEYARWLEEGATLLEGRSPGALAKMADRIRRDEAILLNAGALSGAKARGRRLGRLVNDIRAERVTRLEDVRRFTREVLLPEHALPPTALRAALARGAADAVFAWLERDEARAAGFGEVEVRLRKAADSLDKAHVWTDEARKVVGALAEQVRGPLETKSAREKPVEPAVRVVLPDGLDPVVLGFRKHKGWVLCFKATPGDFHAGHREPFDGPVKTSGHVKQAAGNPALFREGLPAPSVERIESAESLFSLVLAEGAERATAIAVWRDGASEAAMVLVASRQAGKWSLWSDGLDASLDSNRQQIQQAVHSSGLEGADLHVIPPTSLRSRAQALLPRFEGARALVSSLREERLREVQGQFVEPDARVRDGAREPLLGALESWLDSGPRTALLLGEFGSGKSTALAEWAWRRWQKEEVPRPLLANIAGATTDRGAEALLLEAAGLEDTITHRAALRVLIQHQLLVPCFDGFDEMATRTDATELAGRLAGLLGVARGGGRVLVSSRSHYFPTEAHLQNAVAEALAQALGPAADLQRMVLEPLSDEQIRLLVHRILGGKAEDALDRISRTYDLQDLVHRPLLLGMVLNTLDQLVSGAKVGRSDLYEAYLQRWLDQTRSEDPDCFSDDQKKAFAESLAEELWRSGQPSCTWQELRRSVTARLVEHLPESMPIGAAMLEIQGGAFFVHEGQDRYRFAHKSFLEYFLARALVRTLPERPLESLRTRPLTQEVAAFVGEIVRREGEPREARAVRALRSFLTEGRARVALPGFTSEPAAEAAVNALRLLRGLARWMGDGVGWIPEGADLRWVELTGEDLRGLSLVGARLEGAALSGADLSKADLSGARLEHARMNGARLFDTKLMRAAARKADFTQAEADRAELTGADFQGAILRQSMWSRCGWGEVRLEEADVTAWGAPGGTPFQERALSIARSGMAVALATGHAGSVNAGAWDAEGRRLASCGYDGTVRVWDVETGREQAQLRGHHGGVMSVAWDAEGRRLASCGNDGTVRLWGSEDPEQFIFRALFSAIDGSSFVRTQGGFFSASVDIPERIHLALPCPGAHVGTTFYLPLAGLHDFLHRPDKVSAALVGDLSGDDAWAELERMGLGEGHAWSGEAERITPSRSQERLPNPFRPGPALTGSSHLPGREDALADLQALIESRSPAILRGPRRAGKTSLLNALARRLASTHQVRHLTLEARNIVTDDDLARVLEPSLGNDPRPAAMLRARLRQESAAVLLLDEIANLLRADASVFAWLRAVGQESTSVVLVGSHWDWAQVVHHAASAPGSSFGNDVTPVTLGPLSEAAALDFLEKTAPPDVPLPAKGAGRLLVERCGAWPFYLQVMGYAVVQAARAGNRQPLVERAAVTELYEDRLLVDRDVGYFRTRWAELPPRAQAVLWRVRASEEGSLPAIRNLAPEERKVLRDTGLCDSLGRWVEDKPFYDWLRRIADEDLGRNG